MSFKLILMIDESSGVTLCVCIYTSSSEGSDRKNEQLQQMPLTKLLFQRSRSNNEHTIYENGNGDDGDASQILTNSPYLSPSQ